MGFLDAVFGGGKKLKGPAPDRIFAMTTAYVTMQTGLGIESSGAAGIVFQPLATADFEQILKDAEELLRGGHVQVGGLEGDGCADGLEFKLALTPFLVIALNTISTELQAGGYGDRLLCAVFAFKADNRPTYFIYNYKRGKFYPFVPAQGEQQHDSERELRLKAQLDKELPIEPELERWFPLWEIPL